jgi:hypothetical protein
MWLVARRVAEVYTALCAGESSQDDAFGSLGDLLNEDVAYRASGQLAEDRHYWREALAARPEPGSLTLSSRPSSKPGSFLRATAYVPSSCEIELRALATRSRTTLARVMTAATAMFLHRLSGADDAVIGVPVAARSAGLRRIPGMASNVLPLRLALQPGMTVADVLDQTSQRLNSDLQHQRYQLADLRHDVGGGVDGRTLFGVSVNVMPFDYGFRFAGHGGIASNLSLGPVEDLNISVYDRADGAPLRVDFDINPALHTVADLDSYRQRFLRLLEAIADADRPIGNLSILDAAERDRHWYFPNCSPPRWRARRMRWRWCSRSARSATRCSTPGRTGWRIICKAWASVPRPWSDYASSALSRR